MEEAVVESEAIKEAAKAKQIERRLELKKEKERAAEQADRVAGAGGACSEGGVHLTPHHHL